MRDEILNTKNQALAQIIEAASSEELEQIRIEYLGRKGKFSRIIKGVRLVSPIERKQIGLTINETKKIILKNIKSKQNDFKRSVRTWFDPTLPGVKPTNGHLHLVTQAINEISSIFEKVGFVRVRYPEVEWDWFAYTALNFPPNHPARDEMETFLVDAPENNKLGKMLLSPHTSSGQVREMQRVKKTLPAGRQAPIKFINIAKCYRRESDASHFPMFHQFEGLVIDEGINITHLKGTLDHFTKHFYGPKIITRLRPHNFKFTEPSFEVDITCMVCLGKGCKVCKEGWLEQAGAGMVHPNVLKAGGIDPDKFTGFAFGWGVERALMMKPGLEIPDIRAVYSTNLQYLKQF